jgi:hypothetical protein
VRAQWALRGVDHRLNTLNRVRAGLTWISGLDSRPIMSDPIRPETHPGSPSLRDILLAEFDAERTALIEPNMVVSRRDIPRPAVMCFFRRGETPS